jgi:hypothetical protein
MCTVWKRRRRLEIGKDSRAKGLRARGTYGFIYRPGKTDRGLKLWLWIVAHIPRKSEGGKVSLMWTRSVPVVGG